MLINYGMLSTYDQAKEEIGKITKEPNSKMTRCVASAIAGVVCSTMSLPADNIKTKLMKMKAGPDGKMPYTGVADCL